MNRLAIVSIAALSCTVSQAADIHKAANTDTLDQTTSWVGDVVPGPADTAVFSGFGKTTMTLGDGQNLSVEGLVVTNNTDTITLAGNSGTLTLGDGGLYGNFNKKNLSLQLPVELSADQTWRVENCNLQLRGPLDLGGHTLVLRHGKYSNTSLYPTTVISNGTFRYCSGSGTDYPLYFKEGAATPEMDYVLQCGIMQINEQPIAVQGAEARANNVIIDAVDSPGAIVQVYQKDKKSDLDEKFAGAFRVQTGTGVVLMSPTASNHQKLTFASLDVSDKGLAFFRGTALGTEPATDRTPGTANVFFETAPTLVGGILPRAVFAENGGGSIHGLVSYDTTYGVKEFPESGYVTSIGAESQATDNVRLVSGDSGAQAVATLPSGTTTVNSLFFDTGAATGKGTGGVKLTAADGVEDAVLKVKSGLVVARNVKADVVATDSFELSDVTLDLDGNSGLIVTRQDKQANMTSSAPFNLGAKITNDGGKGVSIGSTSNQGLVYITGSEQSDYTGPTRVLGGNVRLAKSASNMAIPENGTLEIYSGACQNPGNQLPDTASIVIYGGTYVQKGGASNSGNGSSDTYYDLTMYSGKVETNKGSTDMHNALLYGGTFSPNGEQSVRANQVTLAGGNVILNTIGNTSTGVALSAADGIAVVNPPSGAYRAIQANAPNASNRGAWIRMDGGLTFTGNETNANRAEIYCVPPTAEGEMAKLQMAGSQDFTIDDGAADVDLYTNFIVADSAAKDAVPGAVVKKGAGTLMLANGGTYTGGTTVEAGRLIADGSIAGDVSVASGATFRGGALSESGALAIGGDLTFAAGATLEIDPGAVMTVAGTVDPAGATLTIAPGTELTEDLLVARSTHFAGSFAVKDLGKYKAKVRNHGTELWLAKDNPFVVVIQ